MTELCSGNTKIQLNVCLSVQCFLCKTFFNQSVKGNFLKAIASLKGNVKIRFIFLDSPSYFDPK
jgi:hypothetical protein